MLSTGQDVVFVCATVMSSLALMFLLNRLWPPEKRRQHNDLIGWQLSIIGTTYAVILGFMLYTVWTNFGLADVNADAEANALTNLFRLADGLPEQQATLLRHSALSYVDVVIGQEWPTMERGESPQPEGYDLNQEMWGILMSVKAASPEQLTAEDHALYELSAMSEHRRLRQLQNTSRLPGVLWVVLLVGGGVTIVSTCMFGSGSSLLQAFQVTAFSLLIALVLVAIADIDRPFQGTVHVRDTAFQRAQQAMQGR